MLPGDRGGGGMLLALRGLSGGRSSYLNGLGDCGTGERGAMIPSEEFRRDRLAPDRYVVKFPRKILSSEVRARESGMEGMFGGSVSFFGADKSEGMVRRDVIETE